MTVISELRHNPATGNDEHYYRLRESFRDACGKVRQKIVMTVGFVPELTRMEMSEVGLVLTWKVQQSQMYEIPALFERDPTVRYGDKVAVKADELWCEMIEKRVFDIPRYVIRESERKARRLVDVNTIRHTDAREVGAENVCLQAIRELQLDTFLRHEGWSERKINATLASLIARTIYSPSEWKTLRLLDENSAAMELLTGKFGDSVTQREVYAAAPALYALKDKLERHLCSRTDSLFNLTNHVMLFDLTNFYFEGSKQGSKKARFGRSKEKRYDCRLLVLALAINTEGFIRYSSILEGNTADPKSLPDMVDKIIAKNPVSPNPDEKTLVVIDAGIATEENLNLIKGKGYNYLCVSRSKIKDYTLRDEYRKVTVLDSRKRPITLAEAAHEDGGDYYLRVNSPMKAMTERSMNRQWRERLEQELTKARKALSAKGGVKRYDKVVERIGRALGRYPSVSKYYQIEYVRSEEIPQNMADIRWQIKTGEGQTIERFGTYFLRTNIATLDEKSTWDYYNLIREIEATNRQLKTDLNLRPIYHQKDDNSDAHLFFGLLSYWIVNTIRYKLKLHGITHYWTELKRILFTQKAITTEADNALGEKVSIRLCSDPTDNAAEIYRCLGYRDKPFGRYVIPASPPLHIPADPPPD